MKILTVSKKSTFFGNFKMAILGKMYYNLTINREVSSTWRNYKAN